MAANKDKPGRWKQDIARSVDTYNKWFMRFAPRAYRTERVRIAQDVGEMLEVTKNLTDVGAGPLKAKPCVLPSLRMSTCPPLAVDRLIGLAGVSGNLVREMERSGRLPPRMPQRKVHSDLGKIGRVIRKMTDQDVFVWLDRGEGPSKRELYRATTIVADRLCGSVASPIVRNAQEERQLTAIGKWLTARGYEILAADRGVRHDELKPGTYSFRVNVPVRQGERTTRTVNISADVVVMPKMAKGKRKMPLLFEAKSAGDFTNVNKRRKEEAIKMSQLIRTYGRSVRYILFLCGYFDSGYLGYEAAEGIDWIWEHRIDDMGKLGL